MQENKNIDFIEQFVYSRHPCDIMENIRWTETAHALLSAAPHEYIIYVYLRFDFNKNSASGMRQTDTEERTQFLSSGYSPKCR